MLVRRMYRDIHKNEYEDMKFGFLRQLGLFRISAAYCGIGKDIARDRCIAKTIHSILISTLLFMCEHMFVHMCIWGGIWVHVQGSMCEYTGECAHSCPRVYMEVKGQLSEFIVFVHHEFQGTRNSGHHWLVQQVPACQPPHNPS